MKSQINRKIFLGISIAAIGGLASLVYAQLSTNVQNALTSEGLTQQRAREILAASVPVGGIIPYVGGLPLSTNWQICDGSNLRPQADAALKARLNGKTPSMVGRVPIGVAANDQVGIAVGANRLEIPARGTDVTGSHSHVVADHTHGLPSYTGLVSSNPAGSVQPMAFKNENDLWLVGSHIAQIDAGRVGDEGQHRHDLGGTTGGSSPGTSSAGDHSHSVPAYVADFVPASTTVVYIIRIF